jgi:acetylglutamate kinase
VVHGGGPQATELQTRLGQTSRIVAGRRITDADALEVMKMVVAGKVNVDVCAALVASGTKPVGLHGASALAVQAVRRLPRVVTGGGPEPIDFGYVGDVTGINVELIALLSEAGYVPVVACLGADPQGNVYNINADAVANRLAVALDAKALVLVSDVPGVLRDVTDPGSRMPRLSCREGKEAIAAASSQRDDPAGRVFAAIAQGVGAVTSWAARRGQLASKGILSRHRRNGPRG